MKFKVDTILGTCFLQVSLFIVNDCCLAKSSKFPSDVNLENPDHYDSFDEKDTRRYIGAVMEYEPYNKWTEEGRGYEIMRRNAKSIVKFAKKAKSYNADIIIAPEYGLQSLDMFDNNTENFLTFTQYVPDPTLRMVVCDQEDTDNKYEAIKILSCGARNNKIYIVANLAEFAPCSEEEIEASLAWGYEVLEDCPQKGYNIYNTQAVFDRNGALVARYRKQNLYLEPLFTPGAQIDDEAIFVTDFDVAFSLQICFDILFEHPGFANSKKYGIKDVAMSTAWGDMLPFYLANGVQNGWSRGLGVNLLVSGYHQPDEGHLGSGIYKGYSSDDVSLYSFEENSGNVLLVSAVETVSASSLSLPVPLEGYVRNLTSRPPSNLSIYFKESKNFGGAARDHKFLYEDLSRYTKTLMANSNSKERTLSTVCSQDNFCCNFSYQYSGNQTYYLLAFNGNITVGKGQYTLGTQTCAIVWCQNTNDETCGRIEADSQVSDSFPYLEISSRSFSVDAIYPILNHRNKSLVRNDLLDFEMHDNYSSIKSVGVIENLLTITLQGKRFF